MIRASTHWHSVARLLKEFRSFLLRGNLVDLAIAVGMGTVNSLMGRLRTEPDVERPTRDCPGA
jgi:Large-conductance mechanosensitive channel, MscL